MRGFSRFLLAILFIAYCGVGLGVSQNINKAFQLSQDGTGAFGVDTSNSAYFPNHINTNIQSTPSISTAAGTAATITGTDTAGRVTGGSVSTSTTTITFNTAYGAVPACGVWAQNPAVSPLGYVVSTTGIVISPLGAAIVNYICNGIRQ